MKRNVSILFFFLTLLTNLVFAQTPTISRVNPTNWWVGMKNPNVQLLIYGKDLKGSKVTINYPGVTVQQVHEVDNFNYLFVDVAISPDAKSGNFDIELSKNIIYTDQKGKTTALNVTIKHNYELRDRDQKPQVVNSKDFIYLIMPDRFANGDYTNDKFANMADTASNRKNPFLRHGGDLQGVTEKLDYLKELGVTTLWLNPVIENNQPQTNEGGNMRSAYHGYGFTDHYNVDRRLGGNAAYKKMIEVAHGKGLKVIQDAVYNHCGINHWILRDLPMKNWLNNWDKYTNTSYRDEPVIDLAHGNKADFNIMQNGWFVPFLPDLNHKNPFVTTFLIQHALWTCEYFGIDGWRIDTYQYNDLDFMNRCNAALLEEYPNMYITGENAVSNIISQAYYCRNNLYVPFKSNLPSPNDFVLFKEQNKAWQENFGWSEGFNRLYSTLASDLVYENPSLNMTFLDNHDENRFFSIVGEQMYKYKWGIGFLLTTRGTPQLYYGTEILMKNYKNPSDAEVRQDFPGGWKEDATNKFVAANRTAQENEAFDFVKKLANFRKNSSALTTGKLTQYQPKEGVYVYFRHDDNQSVMVIMSQSSQAQQIDTERFVDNLRGFKRGKDVITEGGISDLKKIVVPANSIQIIELSK
jgi:neopullulanase